MFKIHPSESWQNREQTHSLQVNSHLKTLVRLGRIVPRDTTCFYRSHICEWAKINYSEETHQIIASDSSGSLRGINLNKRVFYHQLIQRLSRIGYSCASGLGREGNVHDFRVVMIVQNRLDLERTLQCGRCAISAPVVPSREDEIELWKLVTLVWLFERAKILSRAQETNGKRFTSKLVGTLRSNAFIWRRERNRWALIFHLWGKVTSECGQNTSFKKRCCCTHGLLRQIMQGFLRLFLNSSSAAEAGFTVGNLSFQWWDKLWMIVQEVRDVDGVPTDALPA